MDNRLEEIFQLRLQRYSLLSLIGAIVFYILAVVLGVLQPLVVEKFEWMVHGLRDLMRDVAIALTVGVYLMWTLERLNAVKIEAEVKEYIHSVGEEFIKAVYGKQLPEELFQVVKTTIFDQNFVCMLHNTEIRLHRLRRYTESAPEEVQFHLKRFLRSQPNAEAEYIVAQFISYYEVSNVGARKATYRIYWELERPLGGEFSGLAGLTSVLFNGRQQLERLYVESPEALAEKSHLIFTGEPEVAAGDTLTVQIESYAVRRCDDKEHWQVMIPCRGMQATVIDFDTDSDILIWPDAQSIDAQQQKSARKDSQTNTARLRVSQYLLPYQGITMYWRPTNRQATSN